MPDTKVGVDPLASALTGAERWHCVQANVDRSMSPDLIANFALAKAGVKKGSVSAGSPTADDDITQGYEAGSKWINTTDGIEYVCVDATEGAPVWAQINKKWTQVFSAAPTSGQYLDITAIPLTFDDMMIEFENCQPAEAINEYMALAVSAMAYPQTAEDWEVARPILNPGVIPPSTTTWTGRWSSIDTPPQTL
ncbi:MAG: hypothetical protein HC909_01435 [Blastochloris sp.]|nr:hypothetical protein [Blastochloris sp.]